MTLLYSETKALKQQMNLIWQLFVPISRFHNVVILNVKIIALIILVKQGKSNEFQLELKLSYAQ